MPTALGMMDTNDAVRLREWEVAMAEAAYDEALRQREAAIAGADLYDRQLTDMNDSRCDYHTATVFRIPLNEVRKRRPSLRYKVLAWLRLI